jgi:hypothetical protein
MNSADKKPDLPAIHPNLPNAAAGTYRKSWHLMRQIEMPPLKFSGLSSPR